VKLNALLDSTTRRDVELVALSIDPPDLLQKMARQIAARGGEPTFTFLSDSGHRVIDRYGLLNEQSPGWPHPTTYVIDRQGVVRWKFTELNYKVRPTNEMVVEALNRVRQRGP
jgi:peroxiredoxin